MENFGWDFNPWAADIAVSHQQMCWVQRLYVAVEESDLAAVQSRQRMGIRPGVSRSLDPHSGRPQLEVKERHIQ